MWTGLGGRETAIWGEGWQLGDERKKKGELGRGPVRGYLGHSIGWGTETWASEFGGQIDPPAPSRFQMTTAPTNI